MRTLLLLTLIAAVSVLPGCAKRNNANSQEELIQNFQAMMTGATLVGHSTLTNREGLSAEERYSIDTISRIGSETWLIKTRMKLGSREIPFPTRREWPRKTRSA